jgi:hypothetical protein
MSTFQFMLLAFGAFIVMTGFDWSKIGSVVQNMTPDTKSLKNAVYNRDGGSDDLVEVVKKWDDLKETCQKHGLTEAVEKLNEIFPVLIKVDK